MPGAGVLRGNERDVVAGGGRRGTEPGSLRSQVGQLPGRRRAQLQQRPQGPVVLGGPGRLGQVEGGYHMNWH